jgi:hypothetical protein
MTKNEKVQKIVDRLIIGTTDGSVIWNKTNSIFNSETRHQYSTTTEDGETKFDFEIHLDNNLNPSSSWGYIYMYNKDLVDGKIQISGSVYNGVDKLQLLIYNKWVKATLPTKNESIALDSILTKIGDRQTRRDNILDDILGEVEPKEEITPKKSIWERLGL